MEKKEEIISNKIKCKKCGDIIESKSTNDYKRCSCGTVAIDGGKDYSKRILVPYFAKDKLAIITKKDYTEIKKAISKYYLFK